MSTHTFFSLCVPRPLATVQETNWDAQKEKACVNTYAHASVVNLLAKHLQAASKFFWLVPLLGPNLDPKTGPKQRPKRRNENVIQFWTPFWGPYLGPKNGVSHRRISLLPANVLQADLRPSSLHMNVNTYFFLFVRPKAACYCRGLPIAAMF